MNNKPKTLDNTLVVQHLSGLCTFSEAAEEYPALDDVLTGACLLHLEGATRPLNRKRMYALLTSLPHITVPFVKEATGYSNSHATKVAAALRVASRGFQCHLAKVEADKASGAPAIVLHGPPLFSLIRPKSCRKQRRSRAQSPHTKLRNPSPLIG